jgi:hypothetical protein
MPAGPPNQVGEFSIGVYGVAARVSIRWLERRTGWSNAGSHRLTASLIIVAWEIREFSDVACFRPPQCLICDAVFAVLRRQILALEFAPFGDYRVRMRFEDVFLPAKAATIITLMFHELVTNAAKYGALSNPNGMVTVDCNVLGNEIVIKWVERGGPVVTEPRRVRNIFAQTRTGRLSWPNRPLLLSGGPSMQVVLCVAGSRLFGL